MNRAFLTLAALLGLAATLLTVEELRAAFRASQDLASVESADLGASLHPESADWQQSADASFAQARRSFDQLYAVQRWRAPFWWIASVLALLAAVWWPEHKRGTTDERGEAGIEMLLAVFAFGALQGMLIGFRPAGILGAVILLGICMAIAMFSGEHEP